MIDQQVCVMHTLGWLRVLLSHCCIIIDSAPDKERENQACGYNVMMSLKKKKDRSSRGTWCPHGIRTWERYRPATTMTEWERFVCLFLFFLLDIVGSLRRRVSLFLSLKKKKRRTALSSLAWQVIMSAHHPRYIRESRIGYRLAGHTHNNKTVRPGHKMVQQ